MTEISRGIAHVKRTDPRLASVIEIYSERPKPPSKRDAFDALCQSIIYQQLATRAAETIHGRFKALYGGVNPTPAQVLRTSEAKLRSCGLSGQKLSYLQDLSRRVLDGTVEIHKLDRLSDEMIIEELTQVRGIGIWTAQMFLMFNLGRLDVFPDGDLGIKNGMKMIYGLRDPVTVEKMHRIAVRWRPYRSIGSWYVWKYKDGEKNGC